MRVALLTSGRFTLVDLGRELAALGHDVKVYSLVPSFITQRFGLPARCNRWLGPRCAPFYLAARTAPAGALRELADHALLQAIDRAAIATLEPCDALIAMSGIGVRALDVARRKFGARIFVERSSVHILTQRDILQHVPGADPDLARRFRTEREIESYALADVITVPSQHVWDSFIERGISADRLFLNPFGVSLDTFQPTPAPAQNPPTILMTGAWSLRKGCDVLVAAWRKLPGTRLLHVGPVVDAALPNDPGFEHVDAVPQSELPRYYARAHVFALASREEGLAVVQAQALASGLRLVCTTRTGGGDLAPWTTAPATAVRVVRPDDHEALAAALQAALTDLPPAGELRDVLGAQRVQLSWPASARRYERRLLASVSEAAPQVAAPP